MRKTMNSGAKFLTNFRRTIKLYDSMLKPVCDRYLLTQLEATIISFLHNNPGRDTAADIVELRMLSNGNVSQSVESLGQRKLIIRQQDSTDRRKIHLALTEEATPIIHEIELILQKFRERAFRGFSEEEIEQFISFNDRIAENMKPKKDEQDL